MPNGVIHHRLWKGGWLVEGVAVTILLSQHQPSLAIGSVAGYFLGQYLDPDADLVGITSSEGRVLRRFPVFGAFIIGYWTVYGGLFRRHHRSFWTHSYVISTFIRFVWAFWWLWFLKDQVWLYPIVAGVFIGLCISDAIHIRADNVVGGK